ncbi:glycosyltransferase [Laribacter hongkongensis]|uniref:glycosyltransferase family A protein n=1 Tax=Laribacter hongkongensis TaxID=168471 RepID=UPI001EFC6B7B|nr:glycosyltransferase family 2 protein [Laribacter hongkongensis]MCG9064512.1 glycosyltransferase [Laribacter hongkongensis]
MKQISHSLIIPTRNRSETALAAIESALNCTYGKLQIVVSDNSDNDLLYHELKNRNWLSKLTYHKTEQCLSMRDNWERGIELCNGEIISVIGDDDAVMPDAFSISNMTFQKLDIDVLYSAQAIYKWESYPFRGRRQYLGFEMGTEMKLILNPRSILKKAINHEIQMGTGPGLYYGFVKKSFLDKIKKIRGRWIVDQIPDFDSGYCTLMYAKAYAYSERPLFIQGHSGKSNSGAMRFTSLQANADKKLAAESGLEISDLYLPELKQIKTVHSTILSCQFRFMKEIKAALGEEEIEINTLQAWKYLSSGLQNNYDRLALISSTIALNKLAEKWKIPSQERELILPSTLPKGLEYEQGFFPSQQQDSAAPPPQQQGYHKIVVNGKTAGFTSILDAVKFIQSIYPSLINSPIIELATDARKKLEEKNTHLLQQAKLAYANKDNLSAMSCLNEILCNSPTHKQAISLMETLLKHSDHQDDLINILSCQFYESNSPSDLKKLLDTYLDAGQFDIAADIAEWLLSKNDTKTP